MSDIRIGKVWGKRRNYQYFSGESFKAFDGNIALLESGSYEIIVVGQREK